MGCTSSTAVGKTTEVKEAAPSPPPSPPPALPASPPCTLLQRKAPEIGKRYPGYPYPDKERRRREEEGEEEEGTALKSRRSREEDTALKSRISRAIAEHTIADLRTNAAYADTFCAIDELTMACELQARSVTSRKKQRQQILTMRRNAKVELP